MFRQKIIPKINNFVDDYFDKQIIAEKSFNGIFNYLVNPPLTDNYIAMGF